MSIIMTLESDSFALKLYVTCQTIAILDDNCYRTSGIENSYGLVVDGHLILNQLESDPHKLVNLKLIHDLV